MCVPPNETQRTVLFFVLFKFADSRDCVGIVLWGIVLARGGFHHVVQGVTTGQYLLTRSDVRATLTDSSSACGNRLPDTLPHLRRTPAAPQEMLSANHVVGNHRICGMFLEFCVDVLDNLF